MLSRYPPPFIGLPVFHPCFPPLIPYFLGPGDDDVGGTSARLFGNEGEDTGVVADDGDEDSPTFMLSRYPPPPLFGMPVFHPWPPLLPYLLGTDDEFAPALGTPGLSGIADNGDGDG